MDKILLNALGILDEIVKQDTQRQTLINDYINYIQGVPSEVADKGQLAILADLSIDLDYYENNSKIRKESSSFFGDDVLIDVIANAAKQLRKSGAELPEALLAISS